VAVPDNVWISPKEAARVAGVSYSTMMRLLEQRRISHRRINAKLRQVDAADLERFLREAFVPARPSSNGNGARRRRKPSVATEGLATPERAEVRARAATAATSRY
jgi:excisionase family DNA binding protein